jgi:GT2 family glycosyltransferase/glycosyltransferase involved in cell wall biosynthesis
MLPSAEQLLALHEDAKPAWARFDPVWYLARYRQASDYCNGDPAAALAFYLDIGVQLAHSPSPLFDEAWYLEQNPDVHELIRAGQYQSGFDHFCRHGHRLLSPHWLFDDALYARLHDDMALEHLDRHFFHGRYDHYLQSGQHERRIAHYIFDPAHYRLRAIEAGADPADIDAAGPFTHYLYSLSRGQPEIRPSAYFEPNWYFDHAIGARAAVQSGQYGAALEHFLRNPTPEIFDPVPQFSEAYYRAANRDIAHAIAAGQYRSGFQHFVQFGAYELRRPHPEIDLLHYRDSHARVREDIHAGAARDAFAHLRLIGLAENLSAAPPDALPLISETASRQLFLRRARDTALLLARRKLDFTTASPAISVVMVVFNQFALTLQALASLRDNFAGGIELIIIDNGSTDETARLGEYLTGARIVRLPENLGYVRAANRALDFITAPALLYLHNDVTLGHFAIEAALARLADDPKTGAVCGKILHSHGLLQAAGYILWRDGAATAYLRDAPAAAPAANFVRDVDFGAGVCLLCRADLVLKLGGLDEDFAPAGYEDADLCLRLAGAGARVVYDPAVTVHHLEFGSAPNEDAAKAQLRRGQKIFARKHKAYLQTRPAPGAGTVPHAGSAAKPRTKILFLDDTVPLRRLGAGLPRANDVVRALAALGDVSVFPLDGAPGDLMTLLGDFPDTVEVLADQDISQLEKYLVERKDFYDLIWLSQTRNLARIRPVLAAAGLAPETTPLVLDTGAFAAIRDAGRSLIARADKKFDFEAALQAEFAGAAICRHIAAINPFELDLLKSIGLNAVSLLGTQRTPAPTPRNFADRAGLLFVGAIHHQNSPNLDALLWCADAILPALAQEMEDMPVLNVAGHVAPGIDLSALAASPHIKLHGSVTDLRPLYDSSRVFIAPTRFAAGTPYKIYEAAGHGLPCVATDLLARQLGWRPGTELLTAPVYDARRFAAQIATLYRTETIWARLRDQAVARLHAENTEDGFNRAVAGIIAEVFELTRPSATRIHLNQ